MSLNGERSEALFVESYNLPINFRVVTEFDAGANAYSAVCPELPGCASAGFTEAEASANIEEAIRLYLSRLDIELRRDRE